MTVPVRMFSWEELQALSEKVADDLKAQDRRIDTIIGIARGGLLPALVVAFALNIRDVHSISIVTTTDDAPGAPKTEPRLRSSLRREDIEGRRCLLIDDVVDTGATMRTARRALEALGAQEIVTAAMIWSRLVANEIGESHCEAEFIGTELDIWASVPWEPVG